jgi:UDP-2-acetamido-3-amino-2,3-dideoxy-glucuronate N-acetyltransferase
VASTPLKQLKASLAVVGVGYWGKNLVRNFSNLGTLTVLCDASESVEANYGRQYRAF